MPTDIYLGFKSVRKDNESDFVQLFVALGLMLFVHTHIALLGLCVYVLYN